MAATELDFKSLDEEKFLRIISDSEEVGQDDLASPNQTFAENILEQRRTQRKELFMFAKNLSWLSFLLIVVVVVMQGIVRINVDRNFEILGNGDLKVLAAAVFGQIISVIIVITKSLWDDNPYKEIIGQDFFSKNQSKK